VRSTIAYTAPFYGGGDRGSGCVSPSGPGDKEAFARRFPLRWPAKARSASSLPVVGFALDGVFYLAPSPVTCRASLEAVTEFMRRDEVRSDHRRGDVDGHDRAHDRPSHNDVARASAMTNLGARGGGNGGAGAKDDRLVCEGGGVAGKRVADAAAALAWGQGMRDATAQARSDHHRFPGRARPELK